MTAKMTADEQRYIDNAIKDVRLIAHSGNVVPFIKKRYIARMMIRANSFHPNTWIWKPNIYDALKDKLFPQFAEKKK